jgi:NAD(P)-dependent dehydrogenase (short-subunit alcohol dehydrogenase family)
VLSAGVGGSSPITRMAAAEWDRVHAVNSRGAFLVLREVARHMVDDGNPGAIVVVTSISARTAETTMAHYAASKAAAEALVRVAARELGPHGIRVNAVAPGTTDTPLFAATDAIPGYRERTAARAALGRTGSAAEVAEAIVAVLDLPWVTGQVIAADGGLALWSPLDPREPV